MRLADFRKGAPLQKSALRLERIFWPHRSRETCEDKGTAAAKFILNSGGFVRKYYHPIKNIPPTERSTGRLGEIDSLGVDLLLFPYGPFCFPWQFKFRKCDLETHHLKYPYINGRVIRTDETVNAVAGDMKTAYYESARTFFIKRSCVPRGTPMLDYTGKPTWLRDSALRDILLKRNNLVAHYHGGLRDKEIQRLGFTGIVFLRNGFSLFLRRQFPDLPLPFGPALLLPAAKRPQKDADEIVRFIERRGKELSL